VFDGVYEGWDESEGRIYFFFSALKSDLTSKEKSFASLILIEGGTQTSTVNY